MLGRIALLIFFVAAPLQAARFVIIDPGDTETGRACQRITSAFAQSTTRRISFGEISHAITDHWDAIIWLDPEPSLYESIGPAWKKLIADKSVGLMFVGLPHDQTGKDALVAALKDRGAPLVGVHLSRHLEGCHWI